MFTSLTRRGILAALVFALLVAACSSDSESESTPSTTTTTAAATTTTTVEIAGDTTETENEAVSITAEVWADNWFALWVNGELVGEDSVPITTERSFNAETFVFEATLPLTVAIEAKDFKETDSGIEYIGAANQQMGDGGLIAQFTATDTGDVLAVTSSDWQALIVHRAPLNTECERDADPDATCEFEVIDAPAEWTSVGFDDSGWADATTWTEAEVSPKDGYDEITWDSDASLIWGSDLEVDNTVLLRNAA